MVLGVGIDLIEVARVRTAYEKFGERFVQRILRADEVTYCLSHRDFFPFVAARFAAKEAVSKAFGTGIGGQLGWQDIEVRHKPSGQPYIYLHEQGQRLLQLQQARTMHLSLSHTDHYAVAVAILES